MEIGATKAATAADQPQRSQTASMADFEQFLNLFVSQLRYQDPLSPMGGDDFLAQTAQFSTVEQLVNLNRKMEETLQAAQLTSWSTAASYIGRTVTAQVEDEEGVQSLISGRVVGVESNETWGLVLGFEDGSAVPFRDVVSVSET